MFMVVVAIIGLEAGFDEDIDLLLMLMLMLVDFW